MPSGRQVCLPSAVTIAVASAALALVPANAHAAASARASAPGPAFATSAKVLARALACPRAIRGNDHPVLLVPGAGGDPGLAFSPGFERLLRADGYGVCAVSLPDAAFGDIQIEAEYVVASIRRVAARSGHQVAVIGVSQGGMLLRWGLKWWPDVRSLVGDVIGLVPGNHGVGTALTQLCNLACAPATRQQLAGSRFLAALNRGDETPGRLSYSVISSATDVNVPPPSPTLKGERDDSNTQVQEICPGRDVDHGHMAFDAVATALIVDALGHAGPARASRIAPTTCAETYVGISPQEVETRVADGLANAVSKYASAGLTTKEPKLKAYASRRAPQPRASLKLQRRRLGSAGPTVISFVATGTSGRQHWPLPGALIKVAGRKLTTDADGRASLRMPAPPRVLHARLLAPGLAPVTGHLR